MMTLSEKYELLDLLYEGETKTYRARQIPSGRQVLVHLRTLGGGPSQGSHGDTLGMLWKYLKATLPEGRSKVLDMGEYENGVYVATEVVTGFQSLDQWLQSQTAPLDDATVIVRAPGTAPPGSASPESTRTIAVKPAPPAQSGQLGETAVLPASLGGAGQTPLPEHTVTQTIQQPSNPNMATTQIPPALTEALTQARDAWLAQKRPETASASSRAEPPGESTMIFQSPQGLPTAHRPIETPKPSAPAATESGESTMLLDASLLAAAAAQQAKPSAAIQSSVGSTGSGEFTRLFQTPGLGNPVEPAPEFGRAEHEPAFPAPGSSSGEFTRIFQAPSPRQDIAFATPSSEAATAPGEFTRVFGSAMQSVLTGEGSGPSQLPGNPAALNSAQVSHEAPGAVKFAQGLQPGASPILPAAAPATRRSFLPWVIIIVCASVAALGVFLYFFLRH
ncbi:MAG: hypothetical protein ACRD2O_01630 [Terriglobia bacterium]